MTTFADATVIAPEWWNQPTDEGSFNPDPSIEETLIQESQIEQEPDTLGTEILQTVEERQGRIAVWVILVAVVFFLFLRFG